MYLINEEAKKELQNGRTLTYLSEITELTVTYLSNIFNGKCRCRKIVALILISIRYGIAVNDINIEEYLNKYFTREEEK